MHLDDIFPPGHEVWALPHHLRDDLFQDFHGHAPRHPRPNAPVRLPRQPVIIPGAVAHHHFNIPGHHQGIPIPFGGPHGINMPLDVLDHAGLWNAQAWSGIHGMQHRPHRHDTRRVHHHGLGHVGAGFDGDVFGGPFLQPRAFPGWRRGQRDHLVHPWHF